MKCDVVVSYGHTPIIFAFMAWLELYYFNDGKWFMMDMFTDPERKPGNLGFDDGEHLGRAEQSPAEDAYK